MYTLVSMIIFNQYYIDNLIQALYCIDEWKRGYEVRGQFAAANYKNDYLEILKGLQIFQNDRQTNGFIKKIQHSLYENAR